MAFFLFAYWVLVKPHLVLGKLKTARSICLTNVVKLFKGAPFTSQQECFTGLVLRAVFLGWYGAPRK